MTLLTQQPTAVSATRRPRAALRGTDRRTGWQSSFAGRRWSQVVLGVCLLVVLPTPAHARSLTLRVVGPVGPAVFDDGERYLAT